MPQAPRGNPLYLIKVPIGFAITHSRSPDSMGRAAVGIVLPNGGPTPMPSFW